MIPSSAFQIVGQTADRLEILDPPRYMTAGFGLAVGLVYLIFALLLARRRTPGVMINWAHVTISAVIMLVGLGLLTSRTMITLSKSSDALVLEKQYFGLSFEHLNIPLTIIRSAVVETKQGYTQRIVIILREGEPIPLGYFTGQAGHNTAANAINDFIGAHNDH